MKIIWHGHACFELVTKDGSIVFDPYADGSVRGLKLPEIHADAVVCSHGHSDHSAADRIKLTGRTPAFSLSHIPTFHDECGGKKRGGNLMSVLDAEGLRIVHAGDLGHELDREQLSALGRVDILMIPVGGVYTLDAAAAKRVADAVAPTVIIPMHYRGDGVGLPNIAGCGEFTALYPASKLVYLSSNELTVPHPLSPSVCVFDPH